MRVGGTRLAGRTVRADAVGAALENLWIVPAKGAPRKGTMRYRCELPHGIEHAALAIFVNETLNMFHQ